MIFLNRKNFHLNSKRAYLLQIGSNRVSSKNYLTGANT